MNLSKNCKVLIVYGKENLYFISKDSTKNCFIKGNTGCFETIPDEFLNKFYIFSGDNAGTLYKTVINWEPFSIFHKEVLKRAHEGIIKFITLLPKKRILVTCTVYNPLLKVKIN